MKKAIGLLLFISSVFYVSTVSALILSFEPSDNNVFVGQGFSVDIVVSGLKISNEVVSAYDLDVLYDSSIISSTGVVFGSSLGLSYTYDPFLGPVDPFFGPMDPASYPVPPAGRIDLAELSLLMNNELLLLQPNDSVTLATLSFIALSEGISPLVFDPINYPGVDVKGLDPVAPLLFDNVGDGLVNVTARVPEPATFLLILAGLLGMTKRKRAFRGLPFSIKR